MKKDLAIFEGHTIRRIYDEKTERWWFSVVDIIQVLTQQPNYKAAQNYWNVLKHRLNKEGSQLVTNCNQLKMAAADGKSYLTDVAAAETLLRLVQSVPSPKAEPIKLWLAKPATTEGHLQRKLFAPVQSREKDQMNEANCEPPDFLRWQNLTVLWELKNRRGAQRSTDVLAEKVHTDFVRLSRTGAVAPVQQ